MYLLPRRLGQADRFMNVQHRRPVTRVHSIDLYRYCSCFSGRRCIYVVKIKLDLVTLILVVDNTLVGKRCGATANLGKPAELRLRLNTQTANRCVGATIQYVVIFRPFYYYLTYLHLVLQFTITITRGCGCTTSEP